MKKIEDMSLEELKEFARERYSCMFYKRQSFDECKACDGQRTQCAYYTPRSHFEGFYALFGLEDKVNEITGGKNEP